MADKNKIIAEEVLAAVGGTANIVSVTHCMTRLRFVLKDQSVPDQKKLESIKKEQINIAGGQYHHHRKLCGECVQRTGGNERNI
ncbi:MAG: PTS transporter subunit EIIB [[Ruminococcus] torques]